MAPTEIFALYKRGVKTYYEVHNSLHDFGCTQRMLFARWDVDATMQANKQRIQQHLKDFTIRQLFVEELLWDVLREKPFPIVVDNQSHTLRPLVEKSGVKVYLCDPNTQGKIPADPILRKIEHELTRNAFEHIIVYVDAAKENQVWQWVKREKGKTPRPRYSRMHKGKTGDLLSQKLTEVFFAIEEDPGTTEVIGRIEKAFDTEPVTKKFYKRFQEELKEFTSFIDGIMAQGDKEWYASLMLNRLMFIYFIQRQGFLNTRSENELDGEKNYLRNRLKRVKEQYGHDEFHSFYRYFLLSLFSDLNTLEGQRTHSPELDALLGRIPYLNGGLFDVHQLEQENPAIHIPDAAFEKIFDFFDDFDWHLDDRPLHKDNEINPDVLGYIFEKYINQKQMGAYYTKEDITEYISKNTIIPYLFEASKGDCEIAFVPDGPVWSLLRDNPDEYIYEAVAKGVNLPLPDEIEAGRHDIAKRTEWNKPAPEDFALPTEIWREVVARRQRYEEVHSKLANGEITSINDLITYNLDICKFAQDIVTYCEGTDLLNAFYKHIRKVTVLDPTCGSGAFLFAALNILKPLYAACLTRMQIKVDERTQLDAMIPVKQRRNYPDIETFKKILGEVATHHNRDYFILKAIIINNLYGVDIMEEATEICKLRLFLKLVSQVGRIQDIEPLPDIDFNIRAGNTLIGFTTLEDVRATVNKNIETMLFSTDMLGRIEQQAQEIERGFQNFRKLQTELQLGHWDIAAAKQDLREKLKQLNTELDICLAAGAYEIDRNNKQAQEYEQEFHKWRESHKPFHWYSQFYGIMHDGGFDVIIGNPPYVEYSKVRKEYTVQEYQTEDCGNLYAFVMEQALRLMNEHGHYGLIVPISAISLEECNSLQEQLQSKLQSIWMSHFGIRPAKLFEGAEQRLTIVIGATKTDKTICSTAYNRWSQEERSILFQKFHFQPLNEKYLLPGTWSKIDNTLGASVLDKLFQKDSTLSRFLSKSSNNIIHYHRSPGYWIRSMDFEPHFKNKLGTRSTHHYRDLHLSNIQYTPLVGAVLNSSLFFFWFNCYSNLRNISKRDIEIFPINLENIANDASVSTEIKNSFQRLMNDLQTNSKRKVRVQGTDRVEYDEFYPFHSKPFMDEIDRVLAKQYGLTDEELDFIINYDIKYRMGRNSDEESDE